MALINIWGDESSHTGQNYMVLGTIWQNPACTAELMKDIQDLRKQTAFQKEFHWNELRAHQLSAYEGLVNIFKKYADQGLLKFRAIVVDQLDRNHKIYSQDDELHFYKMYFWLIYKRLMISNQYDIFLDRKINKIPGRLSDLKNTLNNKMTGDHGFIAANIVRRVEARDGSQIELQMADVFSGAIAYMRNGHYALANQINPKFKLVQYIERTLQISLDDCHWPKESPKFNIWCFKRQNQNK